MVHLIPLHEEKAEKLNQKIGETRFRSTEDFIDFYNSGLINKKAEEVVELAQEIDSVFKNVRLQNNSLVFISENEVYVEELIPELRLLEVLVKLKRQVEDAARGEELSTEDLVAFRTSAPGVLHRLSIDEQGEKLVKLSDEKTFKASDEELIKKIHGRVASMPERPTSGSYDFRVRDILDADVSYVGDMYRIAVKQ